MATKAWQGLPPATSVADSITKAQQIMALGQLNLLRQLEASRVKGGN